MLELPRIQYRGFHNTKDKDGNIDGFEFRLRTTYYRGVWLSQLRVGRVIVDGEEFLANSGKVTWIIQGKEYTPAQMKEDNEDFWPMTEAAVIRVKKPGGLKQGYHDVAIRWGFSSSYMPPSMEFFDDSKEAPRAFGGGSNTDHRTMLIV